MLYSYPTIRGRGVVQPFPCLGAAILVQVGIFSIRWNVVSGGQLFSKSLRGLTVYKAGMVYPLEPQRLSEWAEGLEQIIVVEEKRPVIETQLKEVLYNRSQRPAVVGWKDEDGQVLFSVKKGLDPVTIGLGIGAAVYAVAACGGGTEVGGIVVILDIV